MDHLLGVASGGQRVVAGEVGEGRGIVGSQGFDGLGHTRVQRCPSVDAVTLVEDLLEERVAEGEGPRAARDLLHETRFDRLLEPVEQLELVDPENAAQDRRLELGAHDRGDPERLDAPRLRGVARDGL